MKNIKKSIALLFMALMVFSIVGCSNDSTDVEETETDPEEETVKSGEDIETDVVVIGSGIAGLSSAVTAAEEGADVILLEKMGYVGGATIVSGGEILAAGTTMQEEQGIEDSADDLKEYWIETGNGQVDEELVSFIAENSGKTVEWLDERGVEFGDVTFSYNDPEQNPMRNHVTANVSGEGFIIPLEETAQELGVDIRLETPALELIDEDGVITGVIAEEDGEEIAIHADSVILATGGYANNAELMEEYAPNLQTSGTFLGETHQGDGLMMARDAGAEIVAGGGAIANPMDMGATGYADAGGVFLNVTPEGERFANENQYWFKRSHQLYNEEGFNHYYAIMDAETENDGFEEAIEEGTVFKADSIEELAEKLDMDSTTLVETINRYNEIVEKQEDTDFNKPAVGKVGSREGEVEEVELLNSIDEAPYYAVNFGTATVTGTFGGPKTTLDAEVVSESGEIIPGLYAAGEVANGEVFYQEYPWSGASIQMGATMGIQAGKAAADHSK